MDNPQLFRPEVMRNRLQQMFGTVSINIPPRYFIVSTGFACLACLVILFFIFAEFSERFVVLGYINSSQAAAQVYPRTNGIIVKSYHKQGDRIQKGEKLFLIDTSYSGYGHEKQDVGEQLRRGKQVLEKEIVHKKQQLKQFKRLLFKKYISLMEYNQKQDELRELENKKNLAEVELIRYRQSRTYTIRSPIDGTISTVLFKTGQYSNASKPLLKILPADSSLVAELYIPARQAGFLQNNKKVIIRYDAYPYERFGSYSATVKTISQSILTDEEEEKPIRIGEPYYKITANLDSPMVVLYGRKKPIQHGMTLSAVIVGSKRKVWQWVLDPLYSFYGTLFL
nr:HlyD family efflux transporter periplasmic adaptor subunit [Legionella jordanis]